MNAAIDIFFGVVNYLVRILALKTSVGFQGIGVESRTSLHVAPDFCLQNSLAPICHNHSANMSAALKNAHDGSLVFAASPGDAAFAFGDVHVSRFAADEGFVYFNFATVAA